MYPYLYVNLRAKIRSTEKQHESVGCLLIRSWWLRYINQHFLELYNYNVYVYQEALTLSLYHTSHP